MQPRRLDIFMQITISPAATNMLSQHKQQPYNRSVHSHVHMTCAATLSPSLRSPPKQRWYSKLRAKKRRMWIFTFNLCNDLLVDKRPRKIINIWW